MARDCIAAITRYWDIVAEKYLDLFRHELETKPYDLEILKAFAANLGPGARVCDVGCGPCAHVTRLLADQGLKLTGVDVSPRCISLAQQEQPSLQFAVMDMANLAFADGKLDGVVTYYALHYERKATMSVVLREFARVLRPGGRILIVVKQGSADGWIIDPMGSGESVYWCEFEPDELKQLLLQSDFINLHCTVREPLPNEIAVPRIYITAERTSTRSGPA
jgi:ubiquinone/menaquinone biosynthesis C-methylase UbiE